MRCIAKNKQQCEKTAYEIRVRPIRSVMSAGASKGIARLTVRLAPIAARRTTYNQNDVTGNRVREVERWSRQRQE